MKIMVFGVACVGTSTVGRLLANQLGYKFYDFSQEVEAFSIPISYPFLRKKWWTGHSYGKGATEVVLRCSS